ncbi:hypothetical protein Zm00014a_006863 [Zea mays]|uniref:Uncharacterized protein n=1 Tax=Zea mays TaxID=4577 RepID=A0A317Y806_MAIZE|nr:hypothetical protein Zm00014a_006863 [Zea mays]
MRVPSRYRTGVFIAVQG